jgi:hypothetical protein
MERTCPEICQCSVGLLSVFSGVALALTGTLLLILG